MNAKYILFQALNWLSSLGFPVGALIWLAVSGLEHTDPGVKVPATMLIVFALLLIITIKYTDAKMGDYRAVTNTIRGESKIEVEGSERYVKAHKELKKRDTVVAMFDRVKMVLIACVFLLFAIVMHGIAEDIQNVITALGYATLGLVSGGVFEGVAIATKHGGGNAKE